MLSRLSHDGFLRSLAVALIGVNVAAAQMGSGHNAPSAPPPGAKTIKCSGRPVPQLEDIATAAGITFKHNTAPLKKYIVESMSGGVILIDYDRDGWPDIYFTNSPTVDQALKGAKSPRRALPQQPRWHVYRRHCQGRPDHSLFWHGRRRGRLQQRRLARSLLTCLGGNVLYRNNGDGTFTDVTAKAGVADGRWSAGASFGDYDGDGFVDLMVINYVDFHLNDMPGFGSALILQVHGHRCAVRSARTAWRRRLALSQQWRRHIHRCIESRRSQRS